MVEFVERKKLKNISEQADATETGGSPLQGRYRSILVGDKVQCRTTSVVLVVFFLSFELFLSLVFVTFFLFFHRLIKIRQSFCRLSRKKIEKKKKKSEEVFTRLKPSERPPIWNCVFK